MGFLFGCCCFVKGSLLRWSLTVGRIEPDQVEGEIIHSVTAPLLGNSDATQHLCGCPWAMCPVPQEDYALESLKEKKIRNRAQGQPWDLQASPFNPCKALMGCVPGLSLDPSTWS